MKRRLFVPLAVIAAAGLPALALAGGTAMSPIVSAKLTGKAEAPTKGPAAGSGIAVLHLNAAKGRVCWDFKKVRGIGKPTAAHIHEGPAGKAGPVVVPFGKSYKAKGCVTAPKKAEVGEIEEHPNGYYVNVHTKKYPNGAIRGQLVAGMIGG
jgi:CHRD domain